MSRLLRFLLRGARPGVPERRALSGYFVCLLSLVAAEFSRQALLPLFGDRFLFLSFFPAVLFSAWYGGAGPGLLAAGGTAILTAVALPPVGSVRIGDHVDLIAWSIALGVDLGIAILVSKLHHAREGLQAARDELAAEHARKSLALESIRDGFFSLDQGGHFTYVNRKAARQLGGGEPAALLGRVIAEAVPGFAGSSLERRLAEVGVRGKASAFEERFDSGEWFEVVAYPHDRGVTALLREIGEQRRMQAALRDNEERLRLALDAGRAGVWDWDIQQDRVSLSALIYEFHGLRQGEFGGTVADFAKLVHPDDAERVQASLRRAIEDRVDYLLEFRTVRPGGEVRWLETSARVLHDAEGRPLRMIGATVDTTSRKLAEEQREALLASERAALAQSERASRMKDEFLSNLSHELRTPLHAILGWTQLLRDEPFLAAAPPDVLLGLETIDRNARAQVRMIDELLDLSRIASGKIRLEIREHDLPQVIDAALESIHPTAEVKGVSIERRFPRRACVIQGDAGRLQQVLWNLLSNAIKFTPRGGHVKVEIEESESRVAVHVRDDGQGIDPDFLPHVFERFRQADASITRRHGGLGLGLAIVRQLVELHGGDVRAASDGKDRGTCMTVSLPRVVGPQRAVHDAPSAAGGRSGSEGPAGPRPDLAGLRVLVVDDEPDARIVIERALAQCGAEVRCAADAREAWQAWSEERFDLVVSDLAMPEEDGHALLRRIRRSEAEGVRTPAIALSAFARREDADRSRLAGFELHLGKPVEPNQLQSQVALLTGRARFPSGSPHGKMAGGGSKDRR